MTLLNTFELPEANITESNYIDVFNELNNTFPNIIQSLNLQTCDLNTFLSEVELSFLSKMIYICGLHLLNCVAQG